MPSGWWKPETTPSAVSSASRLPERTSIVRAADALGLGDEGAAVARRRGRRRSRSPRACATCMVSHSARKRRSASSALSTASAASRPVDLHLAAEAGQHLLVEDRRRAARQPLVDDEAHRVRADVDDRDRRPVVEAALGRRSWRMLTRRLRALRRGGDKAARRRFFERFAAARQARIGHEVLVGVERLLARRGLYARRTCRPARASSSARCP